MTGYRQILAVPGLAPLWGVSLLARTAITAVVMALTMYVVLGLAERETRTLRRGFLAVPTLSSVAEAVSRLAPAGVRGEVTGLQARQWRRPPCFRGRPAVNWSRRRLPPGPSVASPRSSPQTRIRLMGRG
ncbi:hypothetical protein GCM10010353_45100 [Streptomyces chryseus]|nr:hypothetical protein GCM10010353_45100 [Streptomyces chryseus]